MRGRSRSEERGERKNKGGKTKEQTGEIRTEQEERGQGPK